MLSVKVSYVLELSPQEYRIISAALRGTLKPEWQGEAAALQERLFQERNRELRTKLANFKHYEDE